MMVATAPFGSSNFDYPAIELKNYTPGKEPVTENQKEEENAEGVGQEPTTSEDKTPSNEEKIIMPEQKQMPVQQQLPTFLPNRTIS